MQHNGQAKLDAIEKMIAEGRTIYFYTYTRCTEVSPKTFNSFKECGGLFKVDRNDSLYIRRGKNWDCVDHSKITMDAA